MGSVLTVGGAAVLAVIAAAGRQATMQQTSMLLRPARVSLSQWKQGSSSWIMSCLLCQG